MSEFILLDDIRGYERLYLTLEKDDMLRPGQFSMLYTLYQSNCVSCGQTEYLDYDAFCERLAASDEKPYATQIQTIKALDLLMWNIEPVVAQQYNANAYERFNGISETYRLGFKDEQGCQPRSQFTSYGQCEDTLYPETEPTAELCVVKVEPNYEPKLVYICAPLRGDVEVNIIKAREYAREVFLQGDIPICPHIYFPQFASVNVHQEDKVAMEMAITLLSKCQQVNVYADQPTEGMRVEIEAAEKLRIPIENKTVPDEPLKNYYQCR